MSLIQESVGPDGGRTWRHLSSEVFYTRDEGGNFAWRCTACTAAGLPGGNWTRTYRHYLVRSALAHQKPCVGCEREVFFGRDPSECRSCRRVVHHLRRAADNPDVNANAYHVSSELPFPDLEGSRVVGTAWGRCLPSTP